MSRLESSKTLQLIEKIYQTPIEQIFAILNKPLPKDRRQKQWRPNSWDISDAAFGDAGKGSITDRINETASLDKPIVSIRYNGGGNAGHDITKPNGQQITTHHLPVAITTEGATAMIARTCALQPTDLVREYNAIKEQYGGELPGNLAIDPLTLVGTSVHKAMEGTIKIWHQLCSGHAGGQGATGNGISFIYADKLIRQHLSVRDLLSKDWQTAFADHYRQNSAQIDGIRRSRRGSSIPSLSETEIWEFNGHTRDKKSVGSLDQFLEQLSAIREPLRQVTDSNWRTNLRDAWSNTSIPVSFEGAQGPGLAPWVGIDPDITASHSTAASIIDATYGIASAQEIQHHFGVLKTYLSSVGSRRLPDIINANLEAVFQWIQTEFSEQGKTTGRKRDIYPLEFNMLNYFRRADGYRQIALTHLDASHPDIPVPIISRLSHKHDHTPAEYYPDQRLIDQIQAEVSYLPSWDGSLVNQARCITDLPENAIRFIYLIEQAMGVPVTIVKTGPRFEDVITNHL